MKRWAPCVLLVLWACGSKAPTTASVVPLPLAVETDHYRFYAAAANSVNAAWQETYHAWAIARLGVQPTRKVSYYKYRSRQDMGEHTGQYNANAYAVRDAFAIHTLSSYDNHEVVHLFMSLIGDATGLFSEGIAVAFQTDPTAGNFDSVYNGQDVHQSARVYLAAGLLVLPLDRIVETSGFRAITDSDLAYREAGSFVRFLIDRYGLDRLLAFYRVGNISDSADTVKANFLAAFGVPLGESETAWLAMLRN
jgi:hypothetical protein